MLQPGDAVPDFQVRTLDGEVVAYAAIWQRRNLVLVVLPPGAVDTRVPADLSTLRAECEGRESVCVITRDAVAGLPAPAALVADRWGEIVHVAAAPDVGALPPAADLLDWVEHLEHRCPECEGEAR